MLVDGQESPSESRFVRINGLRPGRWIQDTEGYVVLASETGVTTVAPEHVARKGPATAINQPA